jgi:surfactin synthase thioesterase subunit
MTTASGAMQQGPAAARSAGSARSAGAPPDAACWFVCFPHAGAGASVYAHWARLLPAGLALRTVEPPACGARERAAARRSARSYARALLPSVVPLTDRPIVLFGHSLGALVAFELAREMRRTGLTAPSHLYVSGRQAPHIKPVGTVTWDLPDAALVGFLRRLGGTPATLLDDPDMLAMFLPPLRADLAMNERYLHAEEDPLDTPITAFAASEDERAAQAEVAEWALHTTRSFSLVPVRGGHFAVLAQPRIVIDRVAHDRGTRA